MVEMVTAARKLPDWEAGPITYPTSKKVLLTLMLMGPPLLFAIFWTLLHGGWDIGLVGITVGWVVFLFTNQWRATKRAALRGRSLRPLDDARFANIVGGLASAHGIVMPELYVIEEGGPNALVVQRSKPRLAVTRSLLDGYTRTEQEAVAAHCLLRLASGQVFFQYLAASLGRSGSRFAPQVGFLDDVRTAALTRYPPALAAAIAKAKPVDDSTSPFWFVAHDPSHRHPTERIAALQDL